MKNKKALSMVFLGCLIAIIGLVYIVWVFNQPCKPPQKPKNVPLSAVYIGGCDGGNWVELVSLKNDTFRFRIYRDWNGKLILDANFTNCTCNNFRLSKMNWFEHIEFFDNNKLYLFDKSESKINNCSITPIIPVYYEEK